MVIGLALFYGGIGQLLAGMWEFKKANTFGALAFTSYGAFWLSFAYLIRYTDLTKATDVNQALGVFVLMWTIFTLYMTVAAVRVSAAVGAVFVLLTLTFAALTVGYLDNSTDWHKLGGYLGRRHGDRRLVRVDGGRHQRDLGPHRDADLPRPTNRWPRPHGASSRRARTSTSAVLRPTAEVSPTPQDRAHDRQHARHRRTSEGAERP